MRTNRTISNISRVLAISAFSAMTFGPSAVAQPAPIRIPLADASGRVQAFMLIFGSSTIQFQGASGNLLLTGTQAVPRQPFPRLARSSDPLDRPGDFAQEVTVQYLQAQVTELRSKLNAAIARIDQLSQ